MHSTGLNFLCLYSMYVLWTLANSLTSLSLCVPVSSRSVKEVAAIKTNIGFARAFVRWELVSLKSVSMVPSYLHMMCYRYFNFDEIEPRCHVLFRCTHGWSIDLQIGIRTKNTWASNIIAYHLVCLLVIISALGSNLWPMYYLSVCMCVTLCFACHCCAQSIAGEEISLGSHLTIACRQNDAAVSYTYNFPFFCRSCCLPLWLELHRFCTSCKRLEQGLSVLFDMMLCPVCEVQWKTGLPAWGCTRSPVVKCPLPVPLQFCFSFEERLRAYTTRHCASNYDHHSETTIAYRQNKLSVMDSSHREHFICRQEWLSFLSPSSP